MSEDLKKKFMDVLGSLLAVFIPVMYEGAIREGGTAALGKSRAISARVRLWGHYNLAVILRPWFLILASFVFVTTVSMALVFWRLVPDGVSWMPFWIWLLANSALFIGLVVVWVRLQNVRPIRSADFQTLMTETAGMTPEDLQWTLEENFGPSGRLGLKTASWLLVTVPFQAIGMMTFASAMSWVDIPWIVSAIYVLVALLLAGLGLGIALAVALLLGVPLRVVGSIVVSLFKGGWDSIVTMLPNVEGEEAKELLEKDLGKNLLEVWKLFKKVVLSEPGKASVGLLALFIVWHHPFEIVFLTLLFIGLTFSTGFEHMTGNKVEDKVARAGRIVSGFFLFGFLYRAAEMWRFGLGRSEWVWTFSGTKLQLLTLWNRIVPWWNGLVNMSWWECLLVVIVMSFAISYLLKLQEKKIKYALVVLCSAVIAVVLIGFVASRASVDASISGYDVPVGNAATPTPVSSQTSDSIRRMTGTRMATPGPIDGSLPNLGTTSMVPQIGQLIAPSVAVPTIAVQPANTNSASASSNMCDRLSRADRLTDAFRESMRQRYHCSG